jgi:biotin carboxyl carrier protein
MEDPKKINILNIDDTFYQTQLTKKYKSRKPYTVPDPKKVYAIIPGIIRDINVKVGQNVKEGDKILILEAMKMKNILLSHRAGKVKEIKIESGDMVFKNQVLIEFE